MKTTLYTLDVDGFAPEITALTRPLLERYAHKIGANVEVIDTRQSLNMPIGFEKFQIAERAKANGDDWSIFVDADAMIYPDLPDLTTIVPWDSVAFERVDFSPLRFAPDDYFRRDGRYIGAASWFVVCSRATRDDLWRRDLWAGREAGTDLSAILADITPIAVESAAGMPPAHLLDDYLLSRNIARFGLKVVTLVDLWAKHTKLVNPQFFWHAYGCNPAVKLMQMRAELQRWGM